MCLAVPAKVIALHDDEHATVDLGGVRRRVNVMLVENLRLDDYVLLHVGFAIARLDREEAEKTLRLIDTALAVVSDTALAEASDTALAEVSDDPSDEVSDDPSEAVSAAMLDLPSS